MLLARIRELFADVFFFVAVPLVVISISGYLAYAIYLGQHPEQRTFHKGPQDVQGQ